MELIANAVRPHTPRLRLDDRILLFSRTTLATRAPDIDSLRKDLTGTDPRVH